MKLSDAVGAATPPAKDLKRSGQAATLARLLHDRHSTRAFLPDPLDQPRIAHILQLAQRTATWSNLQPWNVVIASGEAPKRISSAILESAAKGESSFDLRPPQEVGGVYRERRRACGFTLYESLGIRRDDKAARQAQAMKNFEFFGAPHVAFISVEALTEDYGHVDAGAYMANFMLAAESVGVATVAQGATAAYSGTLRRILGLAPTMTFVASIAFGLEDQQNPVNRFRTQRATVAESVRYLNH